MSMSGASLAKHVEILDDAVVIDGEQFPWLISTEGIRVEYDSGINFVCLRIIADSVTIPESKTVETVRHHA